MVGELRDGDGTKVTPRLEGSAPNAGTLQVGI
jgi:hypothetical protein